MTDQPRITAEDAYRILMGQAEYQARSGDYALEADMPYLPQSRPRPRLRPDRPVPCHCGREAMTAPTDLDALAALYAKATPGEWRLSFQTDNEVSIDTGPEPRLGYASWQGMATVFGSDYDDAGNEIMENNAALIVALHNQYPVLAAELRALRAELEDETALRQLVKELPEMNASVDALRAENERLREALTDVEVAGPDKDGLVWLQSRRGFMFNLGRAESLATANAVHWDEIRRAALGGKS